MKFFPERLSIEITTRCNYSCQICPKNSPTFVNHDRDMDFETFQRLKSLFPTLKSLVFSGIGEPLLHSELESFISFARKLMPSQSKIAIQTNGSLLSERRLKELVKAGVNKVCVSIDSLDPIEGLHKPDAAKTALEILAKSKSERAKSLEFGIEIVITRANLMQIIPLVCKVQKLGLDFLILSHLIPYSEELCEMTAYDTNNEKAVSVFRKWYSILTSRGYKIEDWLELTKKKVFRESSQESDEPSKMFISMYEEASRMGISLNLRNLIRRDDVTLRETERVLKEVERICKEAKLKFQIPRVTPTKIRRCEFLEDRCVFIGVDGEVSPCYFLWHSFTCYVGGLKKAVRQWSFGNVNENNPLDIYNSQAYRNFVDSVLDYDFPYCYDCNFALCDLMELEDFIYDCFTNTIPCGACLWCGGLFYCMV